MLGLVIGGIVWSAIFIVRYLLHNPIEKLEMADLPDDVKQFDKKKFRDFESTDELLLAELPVLPQSRRHLLAFRFNDNFPAIESTEEKYTIDAETKSALDPLKDETLRTKLRDLIEIKSESGKTCRDLASKIHREFVADVGTNLFKYHTYHQMASDTLAYSMETPDVFPIRQAEVISDFYESRKDDAGLNLDTFNNRFADAVENDIENLKRDQNKLKQEKVDEIRDYILQKTADIEEEIRSSNGDVD